MEAVPEGPERTVDLLLLNARFTVPRAVGIPAFERNAMLLGERRIELAEIPLDGPPATVLQLALGAQPIALVDPTPPREPQEDAGEPQPLDDLEELFPEIGPL